MGNTDNSIVELLAEIEKLKLKIVKSNKLGGKLKAINQQFVASEQQLKATNQQLQASEQQLRALNNQLLASEKSSRKEKEFSENLLETANSFIVVLDIDANIKLFNKYAQKLTNYKIEEVIGKNWFDLFIPKKDNITISKVFSQVLKELPLSSSNSNPIICQNGTERLISWENTIYKNEQGEIDGILSIGVDITEQKLAEEALINSQKKLIQAQYLSKMGDFTWNIQSGDVTWSNGMHKLLKYDLDEKINYAKVNIDIHHPDDLDRVTKWLMDSIASGKKDLVPNEYRLVCKDNEIINVQTKGQIEYIENEAVRLFGTCLDITERVKSEKLVNENLHQMELINANTPNIIWKTDVDKKGNYLNPYISEVADELLALPSRTIKNSWAKYLNYVEPEYLPDLQEKLEQAIKNPGMLISTDYKVKKADGTIAWFSSKGRAQLENSSTSIYGSTIDITERKNIETNLQRERDKLTAIFDTMDDGVYIVNMDYDIQYVNPVLLKDFGLPNNQKCYEYLHDSDKPCSFCKNEEVLKGKTVRWEWTSSKTGKTYDLIDKPMKNSDGSISKFELFRDISDRKRTEEELKTALAKALESDRLKSAFLSNMSHEIRTPMNGIVGFINLLNDPELTDSSRHKFTAIINKSSTRLLSTINDLMDISKIESGQMKVLNTETSINKILDELHAFYIPEASAKGLLLKSLPSLTTEQATVITDNNKLHGVLSNLINNAIKYTMKGSISYGYTLKNNFIEFYVKDTGIGVHKDRQHAIFNRFEQADIEDIKVFEGSGLGLAIAKAYVEMLEGKISLTSIEGKGSKFVFTIPYKVTKTQKVKNTKNTKLVAQSEIVLKEMLVLIVEDEEVSSTYLEEILKNTFKNIIYVETGNDAIEACKNNPEIDIVLMDIKMPSMSGYEATREIRKFSKDLIIIAQTAFALAGDREKAIEAGCNDYISKPIDNTALLEIINYHLKNKEGI